MTGISRGQDAGRRIARSGSAWIGLGLLVLYPLLTAFSDTAMFETSADKGGGGGLTFVGSPSSHGLTCVACHQHGNNTGGVSISSDPASLFTAGFVPGATYAITVRLDPERQGLERNGACAAEHGGCNRNGFIGEFLGGSYLPAGQLCTDSGTLGADGCDGDVGHETMLLSHARAVSGLAIQEPVVCGPQVVGDCVDVQGMLGSGMTQADVDKALMSGVKGRTVWHFQWRAPLESSPVSFHLGAVDGDGGARVTEDHNDFYNDDVYLMSKTLWPIGDEPTKVGGCAAARHGRLDSMTLAAIAAIVALVLRNRRRASVVCSGGLEQ